MRASWARLSDRALLNHIKPRQCQLANASRTRLDVSQKSSVGKTYFFFFLPVFFAFAFFAFLAMLPSVVPCFNASRGSTCMDTTYTTIAELIPRASKKVNDADSIAIG